MKKPYLQSTPKAKRSTTAFNNYSSTDDFNPTSKQKSRLDNSSTHQINIHVEETFINLDNSFASNETNNNEPIQ